MAEPHGIGGAAVTSASVTVPGGVSYVVPALEEARAIVRTLEALRALCGPDDEIIVVDGGSGDATARLAAPWADRILFAPRGRALQMNAGAARARGRYFVFVHADTHLGPDFARALAAAAARGAFWAYASIALDARGAAFSAIAHGIDLRARVTGIVTGDQVLVVRRDVFVALGGFPAVPLMEDVLFSRRARRLGSPVRLRARALTSARRWRAGGVLRTVFSFWVFRLAHTLGVPPERLARHYRLVRT